MLYAFGAGIARRIGRFVEASNSRSEFRGDCGMRAARIISLWVLVGRRSVVLDTRSESMVYFDSKKSPRMYRMDGSTKRVRRGGAQVGFDAATPAPEGAHKTPGSRVAPVATPAATVPPITKLRAHSSFFTRGF